MTNPATSPWIQRVLALLILLCLFATGVATGFGLARWTGHDSRDPAPQRSGDSYRGPHYYSGLGLRPEQDRAVQVIYEKHRPALDAILEETTPRVRAIHEQIEQEIRALLNPDQLRRLETMKSRRGQGRHGRGMGMMAPGMMGPGHGPMDGYGPIAD